MAKKDFEIFTQKIENLNKMLFMIKQNNELKKKLISCTTHEEVVALAKSWGLKIDSRWGEDQ